MKTDLETRPFWFLQSLTLVGGLLFGTPACEGAQSSTMDKTGSETHWLKACASEEDCGSLACLCGVCSSECSADADCGGGTSCIEAGDPAHDAVCTSPMTIPGAICLEPCTNCDEPNDDDASDDDPADDDMPDDDPADDDMPDDDDTSPVVSPLPAPAGGSGGEPSVDPVLSSGGTSSGGAAGAAPSSDPSNGGVGGAEPVAPEPAPAAGGSGGGPAVVAPVTPMLGAYCGDQDGASEPQLDEPLDQQIGTASSATGSNGTFDDYCDPQGNLVEQTCAVVTYCGSDGPGDACIPFYPYFTGEVVETRVDCLGTCIDGACTLPCPTPGDVLTVSDFDTPNQLYVLDPGNGAPAAYECETATGCAPLQFETPYPIATVDSTCDTDCACGVTLPAFTLEDGCDVTCRYRMP